MKTLCFSRFRAFAPALVRGLAPGVGLMLAIGAYAEPAHAVGTRTFTLDSLEKLSGGDLKGTAVASDGTVRAGLTLGATPIADAQAIMSAVAMPDGSTLVGTSPSGKVYRVNGEQVSLFADTGALSVTAMVPGPAGSVYAATIPDGKIFKLAQGKAEVFSKLTDASYVWALAQAKNGALYAAAGPDGRVFRVEPNGQASIYFRSEETHLVSVAVAENGDVYAGSSGKGILYRITGPGRATVLYDFPGEEVKGVAIGKNGAVWAIANEYGEAPEPPKRSAAAGKTQSGPTSGPKMKPGKGVLYKFDAGGRPEKMMASSEFHYLALAVDAKGSAFVGSGAEGRVYSVDDDHTVSLVADTDERQITALAVAGGKPFVAASDPPVFHRVLGQGGQDAVWTSKALDCGLHARFGTLSWKSTGALELSTRTGNTEKPDGTWSAWSNPLAQPSAVTSPAARFVQVRARWNRDGKAVLGEVTLPFVTDNLRPVLTDVNAVQKGVLSRDSKDALPASGGEPPKHDTIVKLTWKVENPDNDPLRYRVAFKKESQTVWRDVLRPDETVSKLEYDWDTQALSEGRYRVRVEASDEGANPPDQVQKHQLTSDTFLVDHTPPVITTLAVQGRKLKAHVVDGISPIVRVEVAVDGRPDFRPLAPTDGLYDRIEESFDSDVSSLVPTGAHLVTLRAFDAAGNFVTREVDAK